MGLSLDWDRETPTCSPEYYKHQQKFFLKLYENKLVYKKRKINKTDPADETVLEMSKLSMEKVGDQVFLSKEKN